MRRLIFLTGADLADWLGSVEAETPLRYTPCGSTDEPPPEYASYRELPGLGVSASGDVKALPMYLVLPQSQSFQLELQERRDGGTSYLSYPDRNPGSVVLQPSGVCAPTHIVPGDLATALKDEASVGLYRLLHRELKKRSLAIGTHNVGEEALTLHRAGYRLCVRLKAHPDLDLVVPESKPKAAAPKKRSKR